MLQRPYLTFKTQSLVYSTFNFRGLPIKTFTGRDKRWCKEWHLAKRRRLVVVSGATGASYPLFLSAARLWIRLLLPRILGIKGDWVLSCARSIVEDVNGGYCPYDHSRFMSVLCMAFLRSGRIPGRFPLRPIMCLMGSALVHISEISNAVGKLGFKVVKGTDTYNAFTYRSILLTNV